MDKHCRVSLVTEKFPLDPGIDSSVKTLALSKQARFRNKSFPENHFEYHSQVKPSEVDIVLYVDCTKLGAINQKEINLIGEMADKVLQKNPSRFLAPFLKKIFLFYTSPMFFDPRLLPGAPAALAGRC